MIRQYPSSGSSQSISDLLTVNQQQQDLLNTILTELQAQSAMQAQAFDLYEGPEGYRTLNQPTVNPSPSP